jgi:hypothetical protein
MISPFLTKLAACRYWIYLAAAAWTIPLFFIARGTAHLRHDTPSVLESRLDIADNTNADQLSALRQENTRLQNELKKLPELTAAADQLREQIASPKSANAALWTAQSNALQTAIGQQKRELAEIYQWSSAWEMTKQREAAQARLAEKASQLAADSEKEYAQTKETLRQMALAQNVSPKSGTSGLNSTNPKRTNFVLVSKRPSPNGRPPTKNSAPTVSSTRPSRSQISRIPPASSFSAP